MEDCFFLNLSNKRINAFYDCLLETAYKIIVECFQLYISTKDLSILAEITGL